MKKWIVIISILVVIMIGLSINVYLNATKPLKVAERKAEQIALEHTSLVSYNDFNVYNGSTSYYVLKGNNDKGEKIIVWIPEKEGKILVKKEEDGITKKEALQKLYNEKDPQEVLSVRLGMENQVPLWEIYYKTENNLINYYWVHFESGEMLKDIQNL
ncbi:DUF5590 domain-containing protein [Bacillus sp. 31A1R]|uniref:DUF5590 domain-containing protein n=1 Tax=Robertmurraya mangrovi TaxID=3098077 RepID=A0ABU5J1F2_9BACI|nr:DUF5590 domain-containing protein [Bacillus sp. 31A1R]MDZ5473226.1 DUF5590 domain-containing protein [Bacillus sp. 31A1R]